AAVDKLLACGVTAIHAATLLTAAAAIARLHELKLRVPEDVSVVTMHDDLLARVVYPQVTTVALPSQEMGRAAASRLIDLIQGTAPDEGSALESLLLPPGDLIVRASVASI
nr:substrate-binding domain-containing protein [Pseudomonadota bacterium]